MDRISILALAIVITIFSLFSCSGGGDGGGTDVDFDNQETEVATDNSQELVVPEVARGYSWVQINGKYDAICAGKESLSLAIGSVVETVAGEDRVVSDLSDFEYPYNDESFTVQQLFYIEGMVFATDAPTNILLVNGIPENKIPGVQLNPDPLPPPGESFAMVSATKIVDINQSFDHLYVTTDITLDKWMSSQEYSGGSYGEITDYADILGVSGLNVYSYFEFQDSDWITTNHGLVELNPFNWITHSISGLLDSVVINGRLWIIRIVSDVYELSEFNGNLLLPKLQTSEIMTLTNVNGSLCLHGESQILIYDPTTENAIKYLTETTVSQVAANDSDTYYLDTDGRLYVLED